MNNNAVIEDDGKTTKYRYWIAFILMITVGISYADRVNISILITNDAFLDAMGIKGQAVQKGLIMSVFLFAYGFSNFVLSPVADILGPRKAICIAIGLWVVSMFMGGMAQVFTILLISRVLLGIGEGMQYPMSGPVIKNWFPKQERGRANATWGIGTTLAPAMAMPLFSWIIVNKGWHDVFWICMFLNLIPMYLIWKYTTDHPRECKRVNALELAYIEEGQAADFGGKDTGVKETFSQRLRGFIFNYRYWMLVVWYIGVMLIVWGLLTWLPSYLKSGRGFSWSEMGWLSSLPFILGIGVKIFTGWAVDYTGKSGIFCILSTIGAGLGIYFSATITNNWVSAILICCAQGFMYMGAPASWTLLQGIVPAKSMSTASGVMIGISTLAGALSPVIIGYFINLTGSYTGALYFLVGAAVLSSVIMIPLAKK